MWTGSARAAIADIKKQVNFNWEISPTTQFAATHTKFARPGPVSGVPPPLFLPAQISLTLPD